MKTKSNGFTLIEILVSLTIFVIGIVLVFPIFSGSLKTLKSNDYKLIVANLAESKLAEIKSAGFDSSVTNTAQTAFAAPYDDYSYELRWTNLANDIASSNVVLQEVELIIYWKDGARQRQESFKTYLSKKS